MTKNTGINARDEKAGKTAKLTPQQAKAVTKKLKEEASAPPPTKTTKMVQEERDKKVNNKGSRQRFG